MLSILARSPSQDGAEKADKILHLLIDMYQKETLKKQSSNDTNSYLAYPLLQPSVEHFRSVFLAYVKGKNKKKACKRIGELLVEMENLIEAGLTEVKPTYEVSLCL